MPRPLRYSSDALMSKYAELKIFRDEKVITKEEYNKRITKLNQRELKLETSKYQECKTQLFDFLLNTEIVMDISNYVVKR